MFQNETFAAKDRWWPASRLAQKTPPRNPIRQNERIEFEARLRDVNAKLAANNCMALLEPEIF
eukprot:497120-Prymnesium_polylepis.1